MSKALIEKWLAKARKHEEATRAADGKSDEEFFLHREVAETLRQCALDLQKESLLPSKEGK